MVAGFYRLLSVLAIEEYATDFFFAQVFVKAICVYYRLTKTKGVVSKVIRQTN